MQKRIAIYGDSWACGEWSGDAVKTKTHENNYTNYMAKYLSDKGHDVSTFGLPGGSNFSSYRRIIAPITSINNFDIGIVIVTEPFRDFPDCVKYNKNKSFNDNCEFAISTFIKFIKKFKHKIILVNGLHELEQQNDFLAHLSWCKTLVPHEKWPKYYAFSAHIKPLLEQIDKDSVVQDIGNNQQNEELFYNNFSKYPEYFFPDGVHPNKRAQHILTEKILEII